MLRILFAQTSLYFAMGVRTEFIFVICILNPHAQKQTELVRDIYFTNFFSL